MHALAQQIHRACHVRLPILLTGENGTGKEVVARALHQLGPRQAQPFVAYNCASIPLHLLESELFGHKKGSFTGAVADAPGVIRTADQGTLLLDEIGDLRLELQPKLLRFIERGEIQTVGEALPQHVDVRLIAATNHNLAEMVAQKKFRADLFHRLHIIALHLPPLRERREDIPLLLHHFLARASEEEGKPGLTLQEEALAVLLAYDWPGNVREVENEMRRAVAYATPNSAIGRADLSAKFQQPPPSIRLSLLVPQPATTLKLTPMTLTFPPEISLREVLVKFRMGVPKWAKQQVRDAWGKESKELKSKKGIEKMKIKDGAALNQTIADLQQVNNIVEWAEPNYLLTQAARQAAPTPNDPQFASQWALENTGTSGGTLNSDIHAKAGWAKGTGSRDTIIAIIDTGIDLMHPDLKNNLWVNQKEQNGKKNDDDDNNGYADDINGWNFITDTPNVSDDHNHGTNMAGLIAAEGNNATGMSGVMWQASMMALKALDASGSGYVSDVVEALDYASANGASVINCSFGTPAQSIALQDAITRAGQSGALVVTSAGNDSQNLANAPQYPASFNIANLLTVAATTNQDFLAAFSNYGSTVHVGAPGIDVLTTQRGGGYVSVTGTSGAAALVSGVAGLLKTQRAWVSGYAVKQSIIETARQVGFLQGKVTSSGVVSTGDAITKLLNAGSISGETNGGGNNGGGNNGGGNNGGGNNGGGNNGGGNTGGTNNAINLDFMRNNTPQAPAPRVFVNSLPDPSYDDPNGSSGVSSYYTEQNKPKNAVGESAGGNPNEPNDPTDGNSGTGATSINLGSQNINFVAPVLSLGGRTGLGVSLALSYNSKVWLKDPATNKIVFNSDKGFPSPGWRIGFGVIEGKDNSGAVGSYLSGITNQQAYTFIEADGSRHELSYNATSGKYESYDSTYMDFDATSKKLRLMNGTTITFGDTSLDDFQFVPTEIKDRNGNYITITNQTLSNNNKVIDYITDTLGRVIDFEYDANRLVYVRQNRGTTASPVWHNYITISWAPITLNTSFGSLTTDPNPVNNTVVWQPWFLTYPSGANTRFFYTSYGQMYQIEKWAPTVSGQGGERPIAYTRYDLPSINNYSAPTGAIALPGSANNNAVQTDCPQFANRYEWAEYWNNSAVATYAYNFNTAANYTTITDPLGRIYRTDLNPGSNPQIVVSRVYTNATSYNNGNGTPLKTISTTYSKDTGPSYTANQRVSQAEITDGSFTRKTAISYNTTAIAGVALPSDVDEYNAAGTAVYRRRHTDYNTNSAYLTRHIYGLPSASLAYSGAGTTLLAKSENLYDESTYYLNSSGDNVIRHDLTNYGASFILGRGNLTTTRQYSVTGGVASSPRDLGHTKFDTQGNAREATDAAGNISYIEMWDNFSNKPSGTGETHAMVNRVISPGKVANAATTVQNGATYDWYTGNVTESFHIQGTTWGGAHQNVVTYTYDSSGRRIGEYRPDGGWTTFNYWENWRAFATYTLLETGKQRYSFTSFDGADRAIWQGGDHPNGTAGWFTGQQMGYDNAGRQNKSTNPTAMNGSFVAIDDDPNDGVAASFEWTNLTLDALDRPTLITRPDNNTVSYNYTGCGCAGSSTIEITDERSKKRKTVNDHLGRLKEAYDLYANGTTYGKAVYSLNELDQMTKIEHYNNGSAHQDRSFAYDGYGRLTSQTIPETGITNYSYTALDRVQTMTLGVGSSNPRTRTFTYEARGLVTDIDYNGTDTQDVHFDYDEYGARTLMQEKNPSTGTVESSTSYTYNAYEQLQTETRNFKGLAGTFKLDYQYNLVGLLKTMTYTVGSWVKNVNYAYNYAGAVTGIGTNIRSGAASNDTTNVANTFNYRGFGAVRTMTYGNGQVMNAIYNAKRLQMTNQTWQKSGTVIVNKSYDYNNGGNNNGRIQKITDNVDSGYTTTYGYDDLNRLTSASNANYTRSYTYDEWANLKSVTATGLGESGSYTFPAYATNASGAPETNRLNYAWSSYDAAGNNLYTGHTFAYDAANRIKSVGTNPQEYDGDGRRVKNDEANAGNITLYYLWSSVLGQVVADLTPGFYTSYGIPYRAYVYSPGGGRVAQQSYDTGFTWIHNDHLGNSHKGTDSTGALVWRDELDPHGQWAYGWSPQGGYYHSRKFTGYERDYASNTHHANARQYHHNNNRFLQADPLGMGASELSDPQSLNLYSYVQNDPVNFIDPEGLNLEAPDSRSSERIGGRGIFSPGIHLYTIDLNESIYGVFIVAGGFGPGFNDVGGGVGNGQSGRATNNNAENPDRYKQIKECWEKLSAKFHKDMNDLSHMAPNKDSLLPNADDLGQEVLSGGAGATIEIRASRKVGERIRVIKVGRGVGIGLLLKPGIVQKLVEIPLR